MTTRTPWTPAENLAVSRLYFDMLAAATAGHAYNKAAMIRHAQTPGDFTHSGPYSGPLKDRTRGSIEAKLMNCSAAHAAIDPTATTMDGFGYRALANYQATLVDAMRAELGRRLQLQREEGAA